jgi:hypothetical protein
MNIVNTATDLDRNTRNHQPGDRVAMKRDPDLGGKILEILPHPAYGQSYLVKWDHLRHPGEGWGDYDLA